MVMRKVIQPVFRKVVRSPLAAPYVDDLRARVIALFDGDAGFVVDFEDTSTLFQDTGLASPVTAATDPVRTVVDLSGNGTNGVAPSDAARPLYDGSGVTGDGVDDVLNFTVPRVSTYSFAMLVQSLSTTSVAARAYFSGNDRNSIYDGNGNWLWFQVDSGSGTWGAARTSEKAVGLKYSFTSATPRTDGVDGTAFDPESQAVLNDVSLFAGSTAGANALECRIKAAIRINRELTASEWAIVDEWLESKKTTQVMQFRDGDSKQFRDNELMEFV